MSFSDMGSRASGSGMIQAPELEGGEVFYDKDDKRTNPDIALSHIGDRVQSLLGHFQKDFEGGVSAENLGPKFGGYGSFLPMYKRSPTDAEAFTAKAELPPNIGMSFSDMGSRASGPGLIQAPELEEGEVFYEKDDKRKNPEIAFSYIGDRVRSSLGHCQKNFEGGVSAENLGPKFGGYGSFLPMHKRSRTDAGAFTGKAELPPSKLDNPTEQRTLNVHLKLGSEMVESARLKLEHCETPYESPAKILQMMTWCGSLLSPLHEDFLSLGRDCHDDRHKPTGPKNQPKHRRCCRRQSKHTIYMGSLQLQN